MSPSARDDDRALPTAEVQRLDQACDAFEDAWKAGREPRIEDYLDAASPPARSSLLQHLLLLEIEYRTSRGQSPMPESYLERFPQYTEVVRAAFAEPAPALGSLDTVGGPATPKTGAQLPPGVPMIPHYEILGPPKRGGMGMVLKARDENLGRLVALKLPLSESPASRQRFLREARAVAHLRHRNICPIHEIAQFAGRPFLVMDYIDGPTLGDWARREQPTARQAAQIVAKVARAVAYAHEQGIIHRDLKPSNVLLEADTGEPMLTDFGLAKAKSLEESQLTQTGELLGTPAYMAPEQALGQHQQVGPCSDVYGLGAILYQLLCGQPPFQGSTAEVLSKIQTEQPTPLRKLAPRIHRDLAVICEKAMAKLPGDRYATAGDLADDLERFCAGEVILARRTLWAVKAFRRVRQRPILSGLIAAAVLTLLVASLFAGKAIRERRVGTLLSSIETGLEASQWDASHLEHMESLVARLEPTESQQAAAARQRVLDRFVASIRLHLEEPRLEGERVEHVRDDLALLEARDARLAGVLEEELSRRLARWEKVFDLAPPFADVEKVLSGRFQVQQGKLLLGDAGPGEVDVRAQVPCSAFSELEIEFDTQWRQHQRLGLRLSSGQQEGYQFVLRTGAPIEMGRGSVAVAQVGSFAEAEGQRWPVIVEICRHRARLAGMRFASWEVPPGSLRLRARRTGGVLSFWVHDSPPLIVEDVFVLASTDRGQFGVIWPRKLGVQRLQARRLIMPAVARALEQADADYAAGHFREALTAYQRMSEQSRDAAARQEALYKAGLCLMELREHSEAATVWSKLALEPGDRWPGLAACRLLVQRLRERNRDEADLLLTRVATEYDPKQLARFVPSDVRREIIDAYRLRERRFAVADTAVLEERLQRMEQASLFRDPGVSDDITFARDILCAYLAANRPDLAMAKAREAVDSLGEHYLAGSIPIGAGCYQDYGWIVRLAQGPARALKELDRYALDKSGTLRPAALALRVERSRHLWALNRLPEAEHELKEFLRVARLDGVEATCLPDAYLILGLIRDQQGDRSGAFRRWREGLEITRRGRRGEYTTNPYVWNPTGGTHSVYFSILAALVDDLTEDDVRDCIDRNLDQLGGGTSLSVLLSNRYLRDQLLPPDRLRSVLRNAWRSPEGYQYARQLASHELSYIEHLRIPLMLLAKHFVFENAFDGTPSAEQSTLTGRFVADFVDRFLGDIDATQAMALAMTWKGQIVGLGWSSVRKALEADPPLRGTLAYIFAHRMLRLGKADEAAVLLAEAGQDAAAGSPLEALVREDSALLGAKEGRLVLASEFPDPLPVTVRRDGQPAATLEVPPTADVNLAAGTYSLELGKPSDDVTLSANTLKLAPAGHYRVDLRWTWKPGPKTPGMAGLVPRPAELPRIGRWQAVPLVPTDAQSMAVSHDGRWLAVAGPQAVWIYDAATLRPLRLLPVTGGRLSQVEFAPDDKRLAATFTAGAASVLTWDVGSGEQVAMFPGQPGNADRLAFSPDGTRVVVSYRGSSQSLSIWSSDGKPVAAPGVKGPEVTGLCWSPDGKRFLSVSPGEAMARIWTSDGQPERTVEGLENPSAAAWSAECRFAVIADRPAGRTSRLRVFETEAWKAETTMDANGDVHVVGFADDGKMVWAAGSGVWIWDLRDKSSSVLRKSLSARTRSVVWDASRRRLLWVNQYGQLWAWQPDGDQVKLLLGGPWPEPDSLAPSPDGRWWALSLTGMNEVRLWHGDGSPGPVLPRNNARRVGAIAWSPDSRRLAVAEDPGESQAAISVWSPDAAKILWEWKSPRVLSIAWSPDGRMLATGGADHAVRVWSADEGQEVQVLRKHSGPVRQVTWSPDGAHLASRSDQQACLWSSDGEPASELVDPSLPLRCLAWSPDGRCVAVGGNDNRLRLLSTSPGRQTADIQGEAQTITAATWSPDGKWLAWCGERGNAMICPWRGDGSPGQPIARKVNVHRLVWSPDSRRLAAARGATIHLLDANDPSRRSQLDGPSADVKSVAWSPDSKYLMSAAQDGTLCRWDAADGECLSRALVLADGQTVSFDTGGRATTTSPSAEAQFLYAVQQADGEIRLCTPAEFRTQALDRKP